MAEKAGIPGIRSYSDFDVFSGLDGLSREAGKGATFFTSTSSSDAAFEKKAELMEGSGSVILGQEENLETEGEKAAEVRLDKQEKEASL